MQPVNYRPAQWTSFQLYLGSLISIRLLDFLTRACKLNAQNIRGFY